MGFRCDEDLRAALQERVESYKYALVARWQALEAAQNAIGGVP